MANPVDIYTTVAGDMWDLIAYKVYGDEEYMIDLLDANPQYHEVAIFSAGVELVCPDIDVPAPVMLPPWRRG